MKIRLLPQAEYDLEIGADFYDSQRSGLGSCFTESLVLDIESLTLYSGIHEQYRGFFRCLSKRFPFSIYYKVSDEWVDIYAILDSRQDPRRIDVILGSPRPNE